MACVSAWVRGDTEVGAYAQDEPHLDGSRCMLSHTSGRAAQIQRIFSTRFRSLAHVLRSSLPLQVCAWCRVTTNYYLHRLRSGRTTIIPACFQQEFPVHEESISAVPAQWCELSYCGGHWSRTASCHAEIMLKCGHYGLSLLSLAMR